LAEFSIIGLVLIEYLSNRQKREERRKRGKRRGEEREIGEKE